MKTGATHRVALLFYPLDYSFFTPANPFSPIGRTAPSHLRVRKKPLY
jgi:hypothetical protein